MALQWYVVLRSANGAAYSVTCAELPQPIIDALEAGTVEILVSSMRSAFGAGVKRGSELYKFVGRPMQRQDDD